MKILSENRYRLVRYDARDAILELLESPALFDMSLKEFSVQAGVFESGAAAGPWQPSDAIQIEGPSGELRLLDVTPSQYYRVTQTP
jgi:hypothetical protein